MLMRQARRVWAVWMLSAAAERLIPHRVKRLRAEFEADIVLRVMKYSAGEAAKTGWRQGVGWGGAKRRHRGAEGSGRSFRRGRDETRVMMAHRPERR